MADCGLNLKEKLIMKVFDNGNVHAASIGDRRTPRLDGDEYCSPECGHGCTKIDFDRANQRAWAIAKQLGSGWEPHVWENLGWHFEVKKGIATVSMDDADRYIGALIFTMSETNMVWIEETGNDPRSVVDALSAELHERIAVLKRALLSVSLDVIDIEFDRTSIPALTT